MPSVTSMRPPKSWSHDSANARTAGSSDTIRSLLRMNSGGNRDSKHSKVFYHWTFSTIWQRNRCVFESSVNRLHNNISYPVQWISFPEHLFKRLMQNSGCLDFETGKKYVRKFRNRLCQNTMWCSLPKHLDAPECMYARTSRNTSGCYAHFCKKILHCTNFVHIQVIIVSPSALQMGETSSFYSAIPHSNMNKISAIMKSVFLRLFHNIDDKNQIAWSKYIIFAEKNHSADE